jgi:hypothetical protein
MAESVLQNLSPLKRMIQRSVWRTLYVGLPLCLAPRIRQFHDFEVPEVLHGVLSSALFGPFGMGGPGHGWRRDNTRGSASSAAALNQQSLRLPAGFMHG